MNNNDIGMNAGVAALPCGGSSNIGYGIPGAHFAGPICASRNDQVARYVIFFNHAGFLEMVDMRSIAAVYGGKYPHLANALLGHRDPRVT
jgi:hypothetical protein